MLAMTSVDTYPVLAFSGLPAHLEDTRIGVFLAALCSLIVNETELGSSNQEASPSACKSIGVALVASSA